MNKTEKEVRRSFAKITPNNLEAIQADCPTRERTVTAKKAQSAFRWKWATCALAVVLVLAIVCTGVVLGVNNGQNAVAATVTLDVNPSVSIRLNSAQRVVRVDALNKDGELIVGNMDFGGVQLELAVNALIGSMLRNGYLSNVANSVLVSVEAAENQYDALVTAVTSEIQLRLQESEIEASVVAQWIRESDEATKMAQELEISIGKAQLITKILNNTPSGTYTAKQLACLSVNDLNLILETLNIPQDQLTHSGNASQGRYIGSSTAIARALEAVGSALTEADVTDLQCNMGNDSGIMVYEVKFVYDGWVYSIDVEAINGDIVKLEREKEHHLPDTSKGELSEEQIRLLVYELLQIPVEERKWFQLSYNPMERIYEAKINPNKGTFYVIELDIYGNVLSWKEEAIEIMPEPVGDWN